MQEKESTGVPERRGFWQGSSCFATRWALYIIFVVVTVRLEGVLLAVTNEKAFALTCLDICMNYHVSLWRCKRFAPSQYLPRVPE